MQESPASLVDSPGEGYRILLEDVVVYDKEDNDRNDDGCEERMKHLILTPQHTSCTTR